MIGAVYQYNLLIRFFSVTSNAVLVNDEPSLLSKILRTVFLDQAIPSIRLVSKFNYIIEGSDLTPNIEG